MLKYKRLINQISQLKLEEMQSGYNIFENFTLIKTTHKNSKNTGNKEERLVEYAGFMKKESKKINSLFARKASNLKLIEVENDLEDDKIDINKNPLNLEKSLNSSASISVTDELETKINNVNNHVFDNDFRVLSRQELIIDSSSEDRAGNEHEDETLLFELKDIKES